MGWLLLIVAVVVLLWLASLGRSAREREALAQLRREFPKIARLRLAAACPGLDGLIEEADLRMIFDWILLQLYGRTGAASLGQLMQWSLRNGEQRTTRLTADISRSAVARLPQPVLAAIDACGGREVAAVLIDQALMEAGQRVAPGLARERAA